MIKLRALKKTHTKKIKFKEGLIGCLQFRTKSITNSSTNSLYDYSARKEQIAAGCALLEFLSASTCFLERTDQNRFCSNDNTLVLRKQLDALRQARVLQKKLQNITIANEGSNACPVLSPESRVVQAKRGRGFIQHQLHPDYLQLFFSSQLVVTGNAQMEIFKAAENCSR